MRYRGYRLIVCCLFVFLACDAKKKSASVAMGRSSSPMGDGVPGSLTSVESGERCIIPTALEPPPPAVVAASACPEDPEFNGVDMTEAPISFLDAPGTPRIMVELAVTQDERQKGLMFRTHLGENTGMLFVFFGPERIHSFWMHNTCIPLDMIFLAEDGVIVGIIENVSTLSDERRSIDCPSKYVLEVNAGWSRRHGVKAGQRVELPKKYR